MNSASCKSFQYFNLIVFQNQKWFKNSKWGGSLDQLHLQSRDIGISPGLNVSWSWIISNKEPVLRRDMARIPPSVAPIDDRYPSFCPGV